MSLQYQENQSLTDLSVVIADYLSWFIQLSKDSLYPEGLNDSKENIAPDSFNQWFEEQKKQDSFNAQALDALKIQNDRLFDTGGRIVAKIKLSKVSIEYQEYCEFSMYFEMFIDALRRIEKEIYQDSNGIDKLTGLRNKAVMRHDLLREMTRFERNGKAFTIGLLRIRMWDQVSESADENVEKAIHAFAKHMGDQIKLTVRSYDDGYYLGDGFFLLSIKQSNADDGSRVMIRLQNFIEENEFSFDAYGLDENYADISCCIIEPMPGEDTDELIEEMKDELKRASADSDENALLQKFEQSPFEKYIATRKSD